MKKIIVCLVLSIVLFACTGSADDKSKTNDVDTSVIGSDNPGPSFPDTTNINDKPDTLKNK